jgi:hypothetical protein
VVPSNTLTAHRRFDFRRKIDLKLASILRRMDGRFQANKFSILTSAVLAEGATAAKIDLPEISRFSPLYADRNKLLLSRELMSFCSAS